MIDSRHVGTVEGFEIDAKLVHDCDTTPDEFDCYSDEQIAAWQADHWMFVGTIITASKAGLELGTSSLWGSEYGDMPGIEEFVNPLRGNGEEFVNGYGPDLIAEAITEARAMLKELAK